LHDREVALDGTQLVGRRVALMVTGGIAAMKAPLLARALRRRGADVIAFASEEALRYVTADALEWSTTHPVVTRLSPMAEHLSDTTPFDAYLVAPATYNTLNRMRYGLADGVITATLASALGRLSRGRARVLVAPTMHGTMHTPILTESLETLAGMGVDVITPRMENGKHNLPDNEVIVAAVCRALSRSPLRGKPVLVTGGPTPVPIDGVRRIVTRFRGRLGIAIAEELYLRGAAVSCIHGDGALRPPSWLPYRVARTYDDYRALVHEVLDARPHAAAILSAAVADYRPTQVVRGKIPGGRASLRLDLVPTVKVVDEVREHHPAMPVVSFKYLEGVDHDRLLTVAAERLAAGHAGVVANRGEETGKDGAQVAWLCFGDAPERVEGKREIARRLVDRVEAFVQV
jgi:phosphopantothenoylcysteine decarboxylase/phosphopantothenate--cysteine ligase